MKKDFEPFLGANLFESGFILYTKAKKKISWLL